MIRTESRKAAGSDHLKNAVLNDGDRKSAPGFLRLPVSGGARDAEMDVNYGIDAVRYCIIILFQVLTEDIS